VRSVTRNSCETATPDTPFVDLKSGYVLRSVKDFPKQASREPWRLYQNYVRDLVMLRHRPLVDEALEFTSPADVRESERVPA